MVYHAFFGRSALTKFIAFLLYTYKMLTLPGPNGIITMRGDVRWSYSCDQESCTLAENVQAKAERAGIQLTAATLRDEGEVPARKQLNLESAPTKTSRKSRSTHPIRPKWL